MSVYSAQSLCLRVACFLWVTSVGFRCSDSLVPEPSCAAEAPLNSCLVLSAGVEGMSLGCLQLLADLLGWGADHRLKIQEK